MKQNIKILKDLSNSVYFRNKFSENPYENTFMWGCPQTGETSTCKELAAGWVRDGQKGLLIKTGNNPIDQNSVRAIRARLRSIEKNVRKKTKVFRVKGQRYLLYIEFGSHFVGKYLRMTYILSIIRCKLKHGNTLDKVVAKRENRKIAEALMEAELDGDAFKKLLVRNVFDDKGNGIGSMVAVLSRLKKELPSAFK